MTTRVHRFLPHCLAGALLLLVGCQPPSLQAALEGYTTDAIAKRDLVGLGISIRLADGRVLQSAAARPIPLRRLHTASRRRDRSSAASPSSTSPPW